MTARQTLLTFACLATFAAGFEPQEASAQERALRRMPHRTAARTRRPPWPILAVVGLREQRITVYDSTGAKMLDSPVSSGADGYETPPGVFSVVQKEPDHRSNLYDDASMPYMQRLTWTGIALHAGVLPGYPASHGCVRLPEEFADRLFDLTKIGMRVVIQREGLAPAPIAEPAFFKRADGKSHVVDAEADLSPAELEARLSSLETTADIAGDRANEERSTAARAKSAAERAERAVRQAEAALAKAEGDLMAAEKQLQDGGPPKRLADAEAAKAAAPRRIEAAQTQVDKARSEADAKREAARQAEAAATAAASAHTKAVNAIEETRLRAAPVSVFVSRKTQRIYVRKAFLPLWEGPILIRDADKPIGTFVFTANEAPESAAGLAWNVLAMYRDPTSIEPAPPRSKAGRKGAATEPPASDAASAAAALGRLEITPQMTEVIAESVRPGASLIISDEPPNLETGKDTDFVVIMSGEPQGGIAIRQRAKPERAYAEDDNWVRPSRRTTRSGGGGLFGLFD